MPRDAWGDAATAQMAVARGRDEAGPGEGGEGGEGGAGGAGHSQMRRDQSFRAREARFSALGGFVDVNALD